MPPSQTTQVTPDARYSSVGRPGLVPADRRAQALALTALTAGLVYLTWRWGWTLDPGSLWIGLPLVLAETYGLAMMFLLSFSCWRLADRPLPPPLPGRDVAVLDRHIRRDRGGASPHGARRPGAAARADPRGVGARRRGPPVGAPDVRGPGRALPLPPGSPPQRQGGQHQSRPRGRGGRVPGDPGRRPRAAAGAARADPRLPRGSRGGDRPGAAGLLQPGLPAPAATRATPSTTTRASSST